MRRGSSRKEELLALPLATRAHVTGSVVVEDAIASTLRDVAYMGRKSILTKNETRGERIEETK